MSVTINDIARIAGVSRTTVSRVLNNKPDVNEETRQMIKSIIKQYDFHPSLFAKGNKTKKCYTLGMLVPYDTDYISANLYYSEVIHGVTNEAEKHGYYLLMCNTAKKKDFLTVYKQKRVDGFILLSPSIFETEQYDMLNSLNVPYVATAQITVPGAENYIEVDNCNGIVLAVDHLANLGHRRIAYINVSSFLASSKERLKGYKMGLEKNNIDVREDYIKEGGSTINGGFDAAKELLNMKEKPTAFVCGNDMLAIGVVKYLRSRNLSVPLHYSVTGFDDIPLAEELDPPLTTIWQPSYETGVQACRMLIDYIDNDIPYKKNTLPVKLIKRRSTGNIAIGR
jgi:LacI family transcriptional regulator